MERNQYDTRKCLEMGLSAEELFDRVALFRQWNVNKATPLQDINEHWDRLIKKDLKCYKVEIKAMKRLARTEVDVQDEWIWIELHGVREHDAGWVYGGKSDLIAFEKKSSFFIVRRLDLINLIPQVVEMKSLITDVMNAKYKIYQRAGRSDKITLINMDDLFHIKWDEWAKT